MSVFEENKEKYDCLPQFLSALAVSLCASVVGGWMSFTSVAIPKLMAAGNCSSNSSHSPSPPCTQAG